MNQEAVSPPMAAVRRCPNCGTRVAQNAETCYFCGHELAKVQRSRRRITWLDLVLVVALLFVAIFWWRMASTPERPGAEVASGPGNSAIVNTTVSMGQEGEDSPTTAEQASPSAPQPAIENLNPMVVKHEVQAGQTLIGIAGIYGVTVEDIQAANNIQNALIRAGDELLIPIPEAIVEGEQRQVVSSIFNYTVRSGDTVVSIATRFGTQVESILRSNNISPTALIRPGQVLLIPVEQVPSAVLASSEAVRDLPPQTASYEAPRLLGPQHEETLSLKEEPLFSWISVELLAPNEWYVLRMWPLVATSELPPAIWTKATSYRLSTEWAPVAGRSVKYGWQVTVVRLLPDEGKGREIQAASTPSAVRTFTWE
jgi:LysM repeat protein/predicted nucleic acid-binding Zn ribbon protein